MAPFPLALGEIFGHWGSYVVYFFIGIAFGAVLEMSGFGNSKKLAAQFYFKDLTVLKVMFTAIIVAMVLVFLASAVGLLDYNLIWVNPTYLWPGIAGGLLMGVGFIVGGFCPGTSLVSAATLKIDGIFFALGVFFGVFLFGETVGLYEGFWHSSYLGRFTLMDLLNVPTGLIVLGVVLMALFMFWGSEKLEKAIGGMDTTDRKQFPRWRYGAAVAIVVVAAGVLLIGQPTNADRWQRISAERETELADREVQIHPGELLDLMHDPAINLIVLDVRDEADFNVFHIIDSQHVPLDALPGVVPTLLEQPPNTVTVLVSRDEARATEGWKYLVAEAVPTVYLLEGGIHNWLGTFGDDALVSRCGLNDPIPAGALACSFEAAVGSRHPAANPNPYNFNLVYTPKVELEIKRGPSGGGCG